MFDPNTDHFEVPSPQVTNIHIFIHTQNRLIRYNILRSFSFMQRIACHIQIFALSIWLPVSLPVEYYEFARGLQWSIPYFRLPWERERDHPDLSGYSPLTGSNPYLAKTLDSKVLQNKVPGNNFTMVDQLYGLPLTPMEYRSFFEVIRDYVSSTAPTPMENELF